MDGTFPGGPAYVGYNPHRIQRELGWRSPDEYEQAYYTGKTPDSPGFTYQRQVSAPPRNRGNPDRQVG